MRQSRYDEDSTVYRIIGNYRRAGVTLLLGFGLFIGWILCSTLASALPEGPLAAGRAFPRLTTSALGWSSLVTTISSGLQYLHAYLYVRCLANGERR